MICPHCGKEIEINSDTTFCYFCGNDPNYVPVQMSAPEQEAAQTNKPEDTEIKKPEFVIYSVRNSTPEVSPEAVKFTEVKPVAASPKKTEEPTEPVPPRDTGLVWCVWPGILTGLGLFLPMAHLNLFFVNTRNANLVKLWEYVIKALLDYGGKDMGGFFFSLLLISIGYVSAFLLMIYIVYSLFKKKVWEAYNAVYALLRLELLSDGIFLAFRIIISLYTDHKLGFGGGAISFSVLFWIKAIVEIALMLIYINTMPKKADVTAANQVSM